MPQVSGYSLVTLSEVPLSLPTTILSLNLFLVSSDSGVNVTVACSPALLTQEPSSSVKHVYFKIPFCLPGGNYNVRMNNPRSVGTIDDLALAVDLL
jgi:hypothetical protein